MIVENKLTFDIFRKPTTTDVIIPHDLCHSVEHKLADTLPIGYNTTLTTQKKETNALKQIVHSNKYSVTIVNRISNKKQKQDCQNPKWTKFTYVGRATRFITKLLKNTNLKLAYSTNNDLGKPLKMAKTQKLSKFDKSGVFMFVPCIINI